MQKPVRTSDDEQVVAVTDEGQAVKVTMADIAEDRTDDFVAWNCPYAECKESR